MFIKITNSTVLIRLQICLDMPGKPLYCSQFIGFGLQDNAAAFPDQHQAYNSMVHFHIYGFNTSLFILSFGYYSAQVPQIVNS